MVIGLAKTAFFSVVSVHYLCELRNVKVWCTMSSCVGIIWHSAEFARLNLNCWILTGTRPRNLYKLREPPLNYHQMGATTVKMETLCSRFCADILITTHPVMCESESWFGFESGFRTFWAGFGFGFRARKLESGFGFKKKGVGSDSRFSVRITPLLIFIFPSLLQMYELALLPPGPLYDKVDSNPDSDSKQLDSDSDSRKKRWIRIQPDSDSSFLDSDPDSDSRRLDSHITDCDPNL